MATPDKPEDLTPEELARVQSAIDAGTIWATVDGGEFAMRLIRAGKCKLAPGVVSMWRGEDGRYEPIYSKEEGSRRIQKLLSEAHATAARWKSSKAESDFHKANRDEIARIRAEEISTRRIMPLWGRARAETKGELRQRAEDVQAKINALRMKAGLSPESLLHVEARSGESSRYLSLWHWDDELGVTTYLDFDFERMEAEYKWVWEQCQGGERYRYSLKRQGALGWELKLVEGGYERFDPTGQLDKAPIKPDLPERSQWSPVTPEDALQGQLEAAYQVFLRQKGR